jgi:hypothetical protein
VNNLKKSYIIIFCIVGFVIILLLFDSRNNGNDIIKDKGLSMDISSVLEGLDKSEEPATENPILKEINRLDYRSFEMARLVAQNEKERSDLREEAVEMINRLDSLAEKIETEQSALYDQVADQISESILDLSYVQSETDMLSLRLAEFLRMVDPDSQGIMGQSY